MSAFYIDEKEIYTMRKISKIKRCNCFFYKISQIKNEHI